MVKHSTNAQHCKEDCVQVQVNYTYIRGRTAVIKRHACKSVSITALARWIWDYLEKYVCMCVCLEGNYSMPRFWGVDFLPELSRHANTAPTPPTSPVCLLNTSNWIWGATAAAARLFMAWKFQAGCPSTSTHAQISNDVSAGVLHLPSKTKGMLLHHRLDCNMLESLSEN